MQIVIVQQEKTATADQPQSMDCDKEEEAHALLKPSRKKKNQKGKKATFRHAEVKDCSSLVVDSDPRVINIAETNSQRHRFWSIIAHGHQENPS